MIESSVDDLGDISDSFLEQVSSPVQARPHPSDSEPEVCKSSKSKKKKKK